MRPSRGYYSIIQYCPDLSRLEAANIGVLLFCPGRDFLKARTSGDNARIRHFFGDAMHDWDRINSFKLGIEERLQVEHDHIRKLEDLESFIAGLANQIQISPPRPTKVFNPEKDLDQLFADLVGGHPRGNRGPSLKRYLRQRFLDAGLGSKIRQDIQVTIPISERQIEVPIGFQNGRFNLIQPAGFRATNPEQAKITACRYAVEGESLYETPHPALGDLQLIVVGKFNSKQPGIKAGVERILNAHHVRLFSMSEVDRLEDEIRRTAKVLPERGNSNELSQEHSSGVANEA